MAKTPKLLEENVMVKLHDFGFGNKSMMMRKVWRRWWRWLHNNVNIPDATELYL